MGDIWDFWYEYRHVVPKGYVRVFAALTELMDAGVKVYFFRGNHDIWSYRYFEEMGMVRLDQPTVVELGGKRFCIGHGDGLGPGNKGYKCLKAVFNSRVSQVLSLTVIGTGNGVCGKVNPEFKGLRVGAQVQGVQCWNEGKGAFPGCEAEYIVPDGADGHVIV